MVAQSDDLPRKEPGQSLETSQNSPLATAAGPTSPPPAMCYTPVIVYSQPDPEGQPGYRPPPYLGYPPNPYRGDQLPSVAYYYPSVPNSSRSSAFLRGCLLLTTVFVVLSFVSTLGLWLILRPNLPVFRLDTLTVSNFSTTRSNFSAVWYANVTVENTDHKLKIYFHQIYSYMFYRDDLLASSLNEKPLILATRKKDVLRVILSTNNSDGQMALAENMNEDRKGGWVNFNFRMLVWLSFRRGWWWTRDDHLKVLCEDLKVSFVDATGNGEFPAGHSRLCSVYF